MREIDKKRVSKVLANWTRKVYLAYKDKIEAIRASGELHDLASFGVRPTEEGYEAFLLLMDYWKYIEDGRLPGSFPPVDDMLDYVRTKPIIPRPFILPSGKQVIPTENQLAYLIGNKIYEDGIPPQPFLYETIREYDYELLPALGKALRDDVIEELTLEFKS